MLFIYQPLFLIKNFSDYCINVSYNLPFDIILNAFNKQSAIQVLTPRRKNSLQSYTIVNSQIRIAVLKWLIISRI